jgi:cytochrome c oxidase cbb3-type subunit 3
VDVERDPVSGRDTTGHIWNGIKELDTPVPKGVLIFLIVTHLFAFAWWILMPTWHELIGLATWMQNRCRLR